jgi:hypothetical protein
MRIRLAAAIVAVALAATTGSVSASGESPKSEAAKPVGAAATKTVSDVGQFATLKGVKAAPMAASELDAVKGLHVHFQDAGGGKTHFPGINNMDNWSWKGGSDGQATAPSYNGICVAAGFSGPGAGNITIIPFGAQQCP